MPACCQHQHNNMLRKIWCAECDSLMEEARVGNYTVVKYIRHGSTGSIYLACQHSLSNRKVVIKVLRGLPSLANVENFRREAEVLATLVHPYILPIYAFDIVEERREDPLTYAPYLVLPYAEQGSLEDAFEREGSWPWSLERVVPVINEAAEALAYAHKRGILHRDVKPGNILLNGEHILLADFGVATLIDVEISHLSAPWAGSPAYMAPEVWHYMPGRYSDQYALAVTCYRLLTGVYPWRVDGSEAELVLSWMHHHCYVAPCPLRSNRADLAPALEAVVLRALAKDPHQRYASVLDFASELGKAAQLPARMVTVPQGPASLYVPVSNGGSPLRPSLLVEGPPTEAAPVAMRTLEARSTDPVTDPRPRPSGLETEAIRLESMHAGTTRLAGSLIDEDVTRETTHLLVSSYRTWLLGGFLLNLLICCVLLGLEALAGGQGGWPQYALPLWPCLLVGPLLGLLFCRIRPVSLSWGIVYGMFFGMIDTLISLVMCWLWATLLFTLSSGQMQNVYGALLLHNAVAVLGMLPLPGLIGLWLAVFGGIVVGFLAARKELKW